MVAAAVLTPPPSRCSDALALLDQACAALADVPADALDDAAVAQTVTGILRGVDRLHAQCGRFVRTFERRRAFAPLALSMVAWLRRVCHLTGPAASNLVETGRRLPALPAAQSAFERGDMGLAHAQAISRLVDDVGVAVVRPSESLLVEAAQTCDAAAVRHLARRIQSAVDPVGAQWDAEDQHAHRRLDVRLTPDGIAYVDGRLDGEDAAAFMLALESVMAPPLPDDDRRPTQRRADAVGEICRRLLDSGRLPVRGGQRCHLSLMVPIDTLRGDAGAPGAEMGWIGSITVETARRLACDAAVTTVVVDAAGRPLIIGPEISIVPPKLRRALAIRDRGCVYPGCDRSPSWCDAHHLVHRVHGGPTTLANLGLLCRRHHRLVHDRGTVIRRGDDGGFEFVERDGSVRRQDPCITLEQLRRLLGARRSGRPDEAMQPLRL